MTNKSKLLIFENQKIIIRTIIILIFILGLSIRLYNLTGDPYGFHADEAAIGYNAYTILTRGTDEYGKILPIFFKSFGEYKSPVEIYSTVPIIYLFGLNEFSTRLTSVVYSILSLFAIYLLAKELFKNQKYSTLTALLSMFFLAISPWDIQFSRVAYELMPYVFFTTIGVFLFLKSQYLPRLLPVSIASFAFALYSYYAGRIFIPLVGLGLSIVYFKFFLMHKKETLISIILLIILLIPFISSIISQESLIRWNQTNIFDHPPRNVTVLNQIELNYLRHFSLNFLFMQGEIALPGNQILRDNIQGIGELYLFQFPLVLLGIFYLFKKKNKSLYILLLWVLLYPIGGIFSSDGSPFARRSIIGVVPFQLLSALGGVVLLGFIVKRRKTYQLLFIGCGGIIIFFSLAYYLNLYFVEYPKYSSGWWGWQYGPKDIITYFTTHKTEYDDLIMAPYFNGRYEFFKFYSPNDCNKCKVGLPENYLTSTRKQLYALPPSYFVIHPQYNFAVKEALYYPNGEQAFSLTTISIAKKYGR